MLNRKNGTWIFNLIRVTWPIIVLLVVIGIAWGTQIGQVSRNTTDIHNVQVIVDANKECIVRIETQVGFIRAEQIAARTDIKNDFNSLRTLLLQKPE